jgi:hypothetical protein
MDQLLLDRALAAGVALRLLLFDLLAIFLADLRALLRDAMVINPSV